MISVDSYGWIERFTGGPKAHRYNEIIDNTPTEAIITSSIVLYEVYKKIKQAQGEELALETVAALSGTKVVDVDQTVSLEAADYSIDHGIHMSDALVYATARHYNAELYTSDEALSHLKSVTFI